MSLRYAVIGTGMMGQEHIRNIALLPDTEIVAIADPHEEMRSSGALLAAQSGFSGVHVFSDHREILSSGIADAIVVASPNDTHREMMDGLLATRLPILLEKPSCTTAEDAWAIARKANGREAPVWVAMEYRYMPPVARLAEEVRKGTAGILKMLSIVEHRYPFLRKIDNWNRFSARSGGTMIEKCCHFFDLMRLITESEPVRVFGSGAQDVNHLDESHHDGTADVLDNAFVIVDFANGMRASLDLCMFAEGSYFQERVSVVGDAGKIETVVPGPARFWPGGAERASEIIISPRADKTPKREAVHVDEHLLRAGDHHGGTYFQHLKFNAIVREGGMPEVSLHDGAMAVEMGAAAERSIREGIVVHLEDRA
ncbi:Gfo/Idh/MocA family protein [Oricola cellulosilytica]|uniref:Gfo/Idh/MocA family oxidoreductase n=1 Tax=Oricola cellulosilytica TaxID=1429082 RepID=A0A4R0PET4_9HYPH|nr:Gfo/Idh/MocA family oxidoreductase [Oricola cellulosilytica]TCD16111.1 Gfo/Idh/MocA family oxidoreductase [Oricola cellulosilytica]